jgi:hypothetical protein
LKTLYLPADRGLKFRQFNLADLGGILVLKSTLHVIIAVTLILVGTAAALQPDQLTPNERQTYERIKQDPQAAQRFLKTREYYQLCLNVVEKRIKEKDLPLRPEGFDESFVSADERVNLLKAEVLRDLYLLVFGDKS